MSVPSRQILSLSLQPLASGHLSGGLRLIHPGLDVKEGKDPGVGSFPKSDPEQSLFLCVRCDRQPVLRQKDMWTDLERSARPACTNSSKKWVIYFQRELKNELIKTLFSASRHQVLDWSFGANIKL